MIDPESEKLISLDAAAAQAASEELPYRVELWDIPGVKVERVLARAASLMLARPIFAAAGQEHFGRRVTLARGDHVIEAIEQTS